MHARKRFGSLFLAATLGATTVGCQGIVDDIKAAAQETLEKEAMRLFEEAAKQFPTNLAVASPFAITAATSVPPLPTDGHHPMAAGVPKIHQYEDMTRRIHAMLIETKDAQHCHFDPMMLKKMARNARCYGPHIPFENHPDSANAATDGVLPHGDLGLWSELEPGSGEACAAAQLNAGVDGVSQLTTGAIMGLASLICTARVNDRDLKEETLDLVDDMNNLGMPNMTFTKATLTRPSNKEFSYALSFDFKPEGRSHRVAIEMTHAPGEVTSAYSGSVYYRVGDDDNRSQCPNGSDTLNGQMNYERSASNDLSVTVKSAKYCGKDTDGRNASGEINPADKRSPQLETGWQKTFEILSAKFAPDTLAGDYSYAWQAGSMDGNSRVFNAHVESDGEAVTGDAFFGYGKDIAETDGSIAGFICNWAGPNNSHALGAKVQHQKVTKNGDKFEPTASHIKYAPTNSCSYDGLGQFRFDSNGDGTLDTDPATAYVADLMSAADANADGTLDPIADSGFVLP